jgi:superfamily II DNA helicase RecQ
MSSGFPPAAQAAMVGAASAAASAADAAAKSAAAVSAAARSPDLMLRVLQRHYGPHASFRPLQREAISAVLEGKDVLLVMATGGGKSATFILPPLLVAEARAEQQQQQQQPTSTCGCLAVVVSPLLALIREQVARLQDDLGVEAEALTGDTPPARRAAVLRDVASDDPSVRLLYTTPEQLTKPDVQDALRVAAEHGKKASGGGSGGGGGDGGGTLALFAVDEAHCVLSWGRDFRPAYLQLKAAIREAFPGVPLLAATATATAEDRRGIAQALGLRSAGEGGVVLCGTANRPNLRYRVRFKELLALGKKGGGSGGGFHQEEDGDEEEEEEHDSDDGNDGDAADAGDDASDDGDETDPATLDKRAASAAIRDLLRYVRRRALTTTPPQAGIVYARTRDRVDALAAALCNAGVDADAFHAGRDPQHRARVAEQWSRRELQVVVSTVAFGMGVDRGDVRFVAHADPPSSVEGYAQESGRAGRDGSAAENVVWLSHADVDTVAGLQRRNGGRAPIAAVADMLSSVGCLRRKLLAHFGERRQVGCGEEEEACDFCRVGGAGGAAGGAGGAPAGVVVRGAEARRAVARWQEIGAERAARAEAKATGRPLRREGEEGEEEGATAADDGDGGSSDGGSGGADKENAALASLPAWGPASAYTGSKRRAPPLAKRLSGPPRPAAAPPPPPPPPPASPRQQQRDLAAARARALAAARAAPPVVAQAAAAAAGPPAAAAAARAPVALRRRPFVPPLRRAPPAQPQE